MLPGVKKRLVNFSDIMMYVAIFLKYGRMITLMLCLFLLGGLTYYVFAKPIYYAKAVIQYQGLPLPVDGQVALHDRNPNFILGDIGSPLVIQRTAYKLGYKGRRQDIEKYFVRRVTVNWDDQRNIVIDVWPYLQHITAPWGETMLQEYLALREERRMNYREEAIRSFTNEMANLSQKMQELVEARTVFKETNEVMQIIMNLNDLRDVPVKAVLVGHRLEARDKLRTRLDDPHVSIAEKLALMSGIKDADGASVGEILYGVEETTSGNSTVGTGPLPRALSTAIRRPNSPQGIVVLPDMIGRAAERESWEQLDRERNDLAAQVAEKSQIYLPAHPVMADLNKRLAEVDKKLLLEYQYARNRFDLEVAKLRDKQQELAEKLPKYETALRDYERMQQHSTEFESSQLAWNTMYTQLAKTVANFQYADEHDRIRLHYIGNEELRDILPVSPNRFKLILMCLAAGLAVSIGLPFLFEYLDYTATDVAEVEDALKLRGLGIVPKMLEGTSEKFPLLSSGDRDARHLLENFRVIRTNLILNPVQEGNPESATGQQVILVASSVPKEGKTAIASNMAIAFAQKGEKTLIIDADLRRGRQHRVFATRTSPGLSNILVEDAPLESTCRPTFHDNLDILTCGRHISGATELLGSAAFTQMIATLRQRYDKIIIDTPPVLGLSETSMMQKSVDGVMFVISSEQTPMRSVKAAIELLRANGARFYGFVLNRIDLRENANYYNYYYYSYHYYDRYQALEKAS